MENKKRSFILLMFTLFITYSAKAQDDSLKSLFKPSFRTGVLLHTYVSSRQNGFRSDSLTGSSNSWKSEAVLHRARIMAGIFLSKKDYVFIQTELTSPLGSGKDKSGGIKILDAQYDHTFSNELVVSAGKILVSHNRNGLQSASALLVNDYAYFQYPYNLSKDSPLQNDTGRDVGVNLSGKFLKDKLQYRLGAFSGRRDFNGQNSSPLRVTGRLEYNFLDIDKHTGTNLGKGKTFTVGGGLDTQGTYIAAGADVFLDYPLSADGSLTLNAAWSYLTGGNDLSAKYSFASMIPTQNTQLLELGYYIKSLKLQPWIRYEKQDVNSQSNQRRGLNASGFDKLNTATVFGGGLSYFFNGYTTNVKLSYVAMQKGVLNASGKVVDKTYGQIRLQLQLSLF
jgi:hypothetical protein